MKDLSQRCIFSGSTDNLNTILEVTLNGEKYKVAVSDEHEDDASLGAIKKLIPERLAAKERAKAEMLAKLDEFKALADELGFDLVKKGESSKSFVNPHSPPDPDTLADQPTVEVGGATFKMQKNTRQNNKPKEEGLTEEEAAAAIEAAKREARHAQGHDRPAHGEAPPIPKHSLPEAITVQTPEGPKVYHKPQKGAQKMQTVKGAGGVPTAIPRNIHGTDGETTITITDTGGDKIIQMRGRQLGQMREMGQGSFYSQSCRPCQGTGLHAKKRCKACDGSGIIV